MRVLTVINIGNGKAIDVLGFNHEENIKQIMVFK